MTPQQAFLATYTDEELKNSEKYLTDAVMCWASVNKNSSVITVLQEQRNRVLAEMKKRRLAHSALSQLAKRKVLELP